jgi:hypothetical protein
MKSRTLVLLTATYIAQFVYLLVGRAAINNIVVACYAFIFHPAEQNRRELLFRHPLLIATLTGLVLGLLPFHALASVFAHLSHPDDPWSQGWQRVKPWIAAPFVIAFLLVVSSYGAGAPVNALPVWQSFFSAPCDLDAAHLLVYRYGCANQLISTAPLTSALVYSLTVLIDRRRNFADRRSLSAGSGTGEIV